MGCNSNERVDPQIIFKLMLLLFCENLPGERMRRRMAAEGLDYLWVLDRIGMMKCPTTGYFARCTSGGQQRSLTGSLSVCLQSVLSIFWSLGGNCHVEGSLIDADADRKKTQRAWTEVMTQLRETLRDELNKLDEIDQQAQGEASAVTTITFSR